MNSVLKYFTICLTLVSANYLFASPEQEAETPEHAASNHDKSDIVESFLNGPEADIYQNAEVILILAVLRNQLDVATLLVNKFGATGEKLTRQDVVKTLSNDSRSPLSRLILNLPNMNYAYQGQYPNPAELNEDINIVSHALIHDDSALLNLILRRLSKATLESSYFQHSIVQLAVRHLCLECIKLLQEQKIADFTCSIDFKLISRSNLIITRPSQEQERDYLPLEELLADYIGIRRNINFIRITELLNPPTQDFRKFKKVLTYIASLKHPQQENTSEPLRLWLSAYEIYRPLHINQENCIEIMNILANYGDSLSHAGLLQYISDKQIKLALAKTLLVKLEQDMKAKLTSSAVRELTSPSATNMLAAAKSRQEKRKIEEHFAKASQKALKLFGESIKSKKEELKRLISQLEGEIQQTSSAGSAVAASSSLRARPTARQRALSPEQVRVKQPQGFASRFTSTSQLAAQQSAVSAHPPRTSCGDAAAASSSNSCAVTQTVAADPLAEARAARQEALLLLTQQEAREQRRDASRHSRYQASSDHALLPLENQPARASSVTRPARGASVSHSRDVTPSHKRDATPQLRPLMLVKDFKTLKAYYDVLGQSGNEGAFIKFKRLLEGLGSPETFWGAYKDFTKIMSSKTKKFIIIEFKLNDELRAYFIVTTDNELVLVGSPHHLQYKKNN